MRILKLYHPMPGGLAPMGTPTDPSEADLLGRGRARERSEFSGEPGNGEKRTLRGRGGPGGPGGGPGDPPKAGYTEQRPQTDWILADSAVYENGILLKE